MMKFLVFSEINERTISNSMGKPEYSYYFVLKEFLPVLQRIGEVTIIEDPKTEVDPLFLLARQNNQDCVFLSFSPPHRTTLGLECPTIPVFAWEFDTVPNESWWGEPEQNWTYGLTKVCSAITHCKLTVSAIKALMGADYPVADIPAPVWDKFENLRRDMEGIKDLSKEVALQVEKGVIVDSWSVDLGLYEPGGNAVEKALLKVGQLNPAGTAVKAGNEHPKPTVWEWLLVSSRFFARWLHFIVDSSALNGPPIGIRKLQQSVEQPVIHANDNVVAIEADELDDVDVEILSKWQLADQSVSFSGVVFTSVFNPYDGRKNWLDMVTAFCSIFKDTSDATLVLKLGHHRYHSAIESILMCLGKMPAFKCRVILIQGFLCAESFQSLIRATDFVVNTSYGEGQCLPLMEYLSCGKPAVAPKHSGMADYVDEDVGFVVDSWLDATAWPHDPRLAYRAQRHQLSWESLTQAYWLAYQCRKKSPEVYQAMSRAAVERMQEHCSRAVAEHKLRALLKSYETKLRACA